MSSQATTTVVTNDPDRVDSTAGQASSEHQRRKPLPTYKHALAIHARNKTSCLSQDAESIPSFAGIRNLMVLVVIVSNLRLMIENYGKYGVLICVSCHDYRRGDVTLGAMLFFLVPCHLFVAYIIEAGAARQVKDAIGREKKDSDGDGSGKGKFEETAFQSTWYFIVMAHAINATLNLAIATYVVYYHIHHPGIGTLCELHAVIVWLKTCSYAFTNRDLRRAVLESDPVSNLPDLYADCPYPKGVTWRNLCYFWWAPTLVYQPVYPRTEKIRWGFVLKRAAEVVGLSIAIWIASAQYAVPLLKNSLPIISNLDYASILERVMKLSSISLFCWLAGFFAIFQSALNLLAEIMRFGDRDFYSDWWNSPSIKDYWSSWNKPVYQFMKRHIYIPLVGRGCPPILAQILVFSFSAALHELLVGVPTHNIIGVAFAGMMFQLPLIVLTEGLKKIKGLRGKTIGNVIFWVSFCLVGQPLAALLYFFAWQAKYGSVNKIPDPFGKR